MTEDGQPGSGRAALRAQRGGRARGDSVVMHSGVTLALGLLALVGEVLLFAGLGQLLHWLAGGGWVGVAVAAIGLVIAAGAWALFMAPTAARRLPTLVRTAVCAVLGLALGATLYAVGWPRFGLAVALGGFAAALTQHLLGARPSPEPSGGDR